VTRRVDFYYRFIDAISVQLRWLAMTQHLRSNDMKTLHTSDEFLRGLRVAVTGGTSGLGLALVRELRARGAEVAFVARGRERVERIANETGAHGIVGDVAKKNDIHPIALQIAGRLGGLDALINNASSLGPTPLALLADTECEDFQLALDTNLLGPFRLTRALLGALGASAREGRGAVVLNVSSDAAVSAYAGWGAYGASKAAFAHMSRIWNEELAHQGIRFLSLDPGDMDTPLHALAIPDADPATLKRPETAARELIDAIAAALHVQPAGPSPQVVHAERACAAYAP
jgi:NAD(P)-dependent dehydrogenase (short-subunit alcohol dehydrogenase family)